MAAWDYVAFRIELRGDPIGGGVWDDGDWDDAQWVDTADDDGYDWTDVTDDYVQAVFTSARRPKFGSTFAPGTATVTLRNGDGDYTLGSVGAVLSVGQGVRIIADYDGTETVKFRGVVKSSTVVESPGKSPLANVVLRSPLAAIASQNRIEQPSQGYGEFPGPRIERILNSIRWPLSLSSIDYGEERLYGTTLEGSALSELQLVALTEGGEVFHDDAGSIVFYDRDTVDGLNAATPVFTCAGYGDPGGAGTWIPWSGFTATTDVDLVRNHVTIGAVGYDPHTVLDNDSIGKYGTSTIVRTDLITTRQTSSWPDALAESLVAALKDPSERYEILLTGGDADAVDAVLASSILEVVRVRRYVGAAEIDTRALIEGIAYTIRPAGQIPDRNDVWTVKLITGHVIIEED